jgi:hypothetical protein
MRFPKFFRRNYPFRGRGLVAKVLYAANRIGLDVKFLPSVKDASLDQIGFNDVAYFWPSAKRSRGRFYGYRVKDRSVVEYLKFGLTDQEKDALRREAENVSKALSITNRSFDVPKNIGVEERNGVLVARYEPIPETVSALPPTKEWYSRVDIARKQIADAGYSHGDFSWHNFKSDGVKLWVLDWEEMRERRDPFVDLISLEYGYAIYWQRKPIDQVMKDFDLRRMAAVEDLVSRGISPGALMLEWIQKNGVLNENTSRT